MGESGSGVITPLRSLNPRTDKQEDLHERTSVAVEALSSRSDSDGSQMLVSRAGPELSACAKFVRKIVQMDESHSTQ